MTVRKKTWVTRNTSDSYGLALKCNFHTRVIIEAHKTPSKSRYDFQPGEVKDDVMAEDIEYLLSLVYQQSACCGGQPGEPINYFVLA